MTAPDELPLLEVAVGMVLVCGLVVVWRRDLRAIIVTVRAQGVALAAVATILAAAGRDLALGVVAGIVLVAKGIVVPTLLNQVARHDPRSREQSPIVNVPASLVGAGALILLAFGVSSRLTAVSSTGVTRLVPIAVATMLVGFLVLVTRRKALSQIVGLLLVDNGIALAALLLTAGVPLAVELGASFDVLLLVVVLRVLAFAMHRRFGPVDLDQLRELHD